MWCPGLFPSREIPKYKKDLQLTMPAIEFVGKSMNKFLTDHNRPVITFYKPGERDATVHLLNTLTGRRKYFQTDHYVPTVQWERVLNLGSLPQEGLILLVVKCNGSIIGYARLFPEGKFEQNNKVGNIGLGLREAYHQQGIGKQLLGKIMAIAPSVGYEILTADIFDTNFISLRLFSSYGFLPVKEESIFLPFLDHDVRVVKVQAKFEAPEGIYACK